MPFIANNTDNNSIKSSSRSSASCQKMFPQGSYRSYKSFLNHYSKEQPSQIRRVSNGSVPMTTEQSISSSSSKSSSISSRSVKSKIAQFDQPQQQQQQRSYSIPNDNKSNIMMMKRNNNNNDNQRIIMKNDLNLEKLLTLSSYEIELLDKDVLERFVQLLVSGQKLSTSTTETSGNGIDLNNNDNDKDGDDDNDSKISTKNKLETDDDDIDQCKMNLIQSLKKQLENYRQTKQIGF